MSEIVKDNCETITSILSINKYLLAHNDFNNYDEDKYKKDNSIINALVIYSIIYLSDKNKLLLSVFFNDLNCNDYNLSRYIINNLKNKDSIFEVNVYTNEFKKESCYTISLKSEHLKVKVNKKDIEGCNSIDEYLRLRELKKKINNF